VAKARPDGHTLLFATSTFATNAAVSPNLPYDPVKDFAPVAMIGRGPLLVVASRQLGVTTMRPADRRRQGPARGAELLLGRRGQHQPPGRRDVPPEVRPAMTHVPFKGSGPATVELLAGRIDLFFATVPTILSHVRDGKVPVLAVTGAQRSPLFPELPTMAEAGVPGFEVTTWWGILAPAGTPAAVVDALNRAVNEAAAADPVKGPAGARRRRSAPPDARRRSARNWRKELALWRGVANNPALQLR
jgi:tripartite-type tricarboxylate transporter receptor subunit TctC